MLDAEQCQDRTLRFLCQAATQYAILAPAVSRSLGRRLKNYAKSSKVLLHPSTEQLFCPKCSQTYVPGCNCRVSTRPRPRRKKPRKKTKKALNELTPSKPKSSPSKGGEPKGGMETAKPDSKAKTKAAKRYVQYACGVCRHRRRIPLPKRRRQKITPQWPNSGHGSHGGHAVFRTVAQKRQAAAAEEAKNAARAAKRQRAKAKALAQQAQTTKEIQGAQDPKEDAKMPATSGSAQEVAPNLEDSEAKIKGSKGLEEKAATSPTELRAGAETAQPKAAPAGPTSQGQEPRRKRKREDKLSRVMNQLSNQRSQSSSGFDF